MNDRARQSILIIDDTPANLRVIVDHLEALGFLILVAEDGEEGVQRAEFALPDLILLDVRMPGIDGFEACRRLKANPLTRDIPLIFMTALAEASDKLEGFDVGAVDYITKPFQVPEVTARVKTHLALRAVELRLAAQNKLLQQEIAVRRQAEAELQFRATHDALTGLPNRTLLLDRLQQALASAARNGLRVVVCVIDLDRFKWVNDSLGHEAGDILLQTMAARMLACVREADTVARLGGDEFVLLLRDVEDVAQELLAVHRVLAEMAQPLWLGEREVMISASAGCSVYREDSDEADELLKFADCAMYRAKAAGRNQLQLYSIELRRDLQERVLLEGELRHAIERQQLFLRYQAQVELGSGRIVGVEALLRWQHPELGEIAPGRFIPLAEEAGLIGVIGAWVLQQACGQNSAWQRAGLPPVKMAVNLSAQQAKHGDLLGLVSRTLAATGLAPAWLELELTESVSMGDPQRMIALLGQLKAMGVALAIDDFGTGYSSMQYLQRLPLDRLKIDGSFVRELTSSPGSLAIVDAIIAMAHKLGLLVVAEWVETEGQLALLAARGCDQVQGYYFSVPVPAEQCAALLRDGVRPLPAALVEAARRRTLLVLDDDPLVTAAVARVLRQEGQYQLLLAHDANEAFELLALHPVGVVLSDQRMPGLLGIEFLERIRQLYPHTVRLLMSGCRDFELALAAINQSAVHRFVAKPWASSELCTVIAQAFELHEQQHDECVRGWPLGQSGVA